jgi:hypothetical protein
VTFKPLFVRKRLLNKIISTEFMNKLPNQYGKTACLYKENIQDQAKKLGLNLSNQLNLLMQYTLYQVKFFLRMVRRALCKIIKVALKNLAKR